MMIPKLQLSVLLSVFSIFHLHAQTRSKITGVITDSSRKSVNAATVLLFSSPDSTLIKTAITDANGQYEIDHVKPGKYFINVQFIGFKNASSAILNVTEGKDKTVPSILLIPDGKNMEGVVVTSTYQKPMIEVTAGKTVFNVENSINSTGSNAFDILQKMPGVVTDKDDNIIVKGKNGIRIYVDGRPTQMDNDDLPAYLRSINSSDIESIEIISNPSAKYDASGNAGIINIRLKKNKRNGLNGSVSLGLNYGKSFKTPENISLNYRNKSINLFSNYSVNWGNRQNNLFLYRQQSDSVFNQVNQENTNGWMHNIKAGADFFVTKKSTVGFIVTADLSNTINTTMGSTLISPVDSPVVEKPVKILDASNTIPGTTKNVDYNLNYRFADSSGHSFSTDVDYGYYKSNKTSSQPNYYYNINPDTLLYDAIYWDNTNTNIDIYIAKLDYETPFKKGKLGFGGKISYVTTNNIYNFYNVITNVPIFDSSQSNRFKYTENVNALYLNYYNPINKKWSIQGGLRVENTYSNGQLTRADSLIMPDDNVKRNYTDLFPSADITLTANTDNIFNLSYSRRIDRPNYQTLNPFEIKLDQLTYLKGNAFLLPQYTNSIELTHTYKYKFNTTISYSHVKDYTARIIDTVQKNSTYITQTNLTSQDLFNINFSLPFQLNEWWNIYANINAYYSLYKGNLAQSQMVNLAVTSYTLYMQQLFTLGHNYTAEVSGYYDGPSIWAGTFKSSPVGGMDIGLQKKLFNDRTDIKLSFADVLNTVHWRGISNYGGAYINASGDDETHVVKFNFTYRFGHSLFKQTSQHQTGSEEESKRTSSTEGLGGN